MPQKDSGQKSLINLFDRDCSQVTFFVTQKPIWRLIWCSFFTKVIHIFLALKFWSILIWRKEFGAKAARKMLVKLTPGIKMRFSVQTLKLEDFKVSML
jgi:hypothetical protein